MTSHPLETLAEAVGLMLLGGTLLLLEFTILSWGLLTVAAFVAAAAGAVLAYSVAATVGWVYLLLCPLLALCIVRVGLHWLHARHAFLSAVIGQDAGYRHHAQALGIAVGAQGLLTTDALPTGRARFPTGELDVQVIGRGQPRSTPVVVVRMEGSTVLVEPFQPRA